MSEHPPTRAVRSHQSLRWRLSLAYVGLLAVVLAGLAIYQEVTLRSQLIATRVSSLSGDLQAARTVLARGVRRQGVAVSEAAAIKELCASNRTQVHPLIPAFANTVTATSGHTVSVVIYDHAMTVAATSPATADQVRLDPADVQRTLTGVQSAPQVITGTGGDQLVVGFPLKSGTLTCGVLQLSTSMQPIDDAVAGQREHTLLGGILGLAVALIAGLLLIGGALRPLHRLTGTARRLASGDLGARSDVEPRGDEVGVLAQALDHMAERIEESFAAQAKSLVALSESEDRTRRFIADASHELRTPVTALKGYIDVIRRGAAHDPATLDAALEAMAREAERMRVLVLDLLTLARVDARQPLAVTSIDLGDLLGGILDDAGDGMPGEVIREFADPPVVVMGDRNALVTVATNLLTNACKYAPGAAQTWTTVYDGARGGFSVHDHGPGIPAADQPHIFERFYRGEKTRAREEGGSGLGMSIVQGLVQAQRGEVILDSTEGEGTTVTVWLPVAPVPT